MASLPFAPPAHLDPAFALARCEPADLPSMVDAYMAAFGPGVVSYWWPSAESMRTWVTARFHNKFGAANEHMIKVVEVATGKVAAWARWTAPAHMKNLEPGAVNYAKDGGVGGWAPIEDAPERPDGVDVAMFEEFFGGIQTMCAKWSENKFDLAMICTHPDYQGRGLGKALMLPVLDIADAEGIALYLEAAPDARTWYEMMDFVKVDVLRYDTKRPEPDRFIDLTVMVRYPKGSGHQSVE